MLTMTATPTGSTVELNWLPPLHPNGAIRYEIEYEPAMTPGDPVYAGSNSSLYFNLTLPNEFLSYTVRVVAVNSQGRANSSDLLCLGKNRERGTLATQQQLLKLCTDVSVTYLWNSIRTTYIIYICLPIAVDSSPGPQPPTNVSVDVSWDAQQSMQCDVVIGNYSVRYQLRNASTAGYTALYTSETHVTLQEFKPGTNYSVSVASITSNGEMSAYSDWVTFTTAMATPSQGERESLLQHHAYLPQIV